jgi:ribosomal protein S18 acetylase RimI-like enzyme
MPMRIRLAVIEDAPLLPPIEHSAGRRFLEIPDLASLPDVQNLSVEDHRLYITAGTEWVTENEAGVPVGFLATQIIATDLHLWEFAVCEGVQGRRIGRQMIDTAEAFARERQLESLTLTTFTDVPWNAPWYSRLGFQIDRDDARLAALVQAELKSGLPRRCAMRKTLVRPL